MPLLFWSAAAWGGAVAIRKDNPDLIADLPQIQAMLDRALELDEGYGDGALRTLLISMEGARTGAAGDPAERARRHFDRALALSRGTDPAPYVALAEQVSVQHQARAEFQELLRTALAIDPDSRPSTRLATLIAQRRARRLLAKVDELFAVTEETNP